MEQVVCVVGEVTMWQCDNVAMWQCDNVAM